MLSSSGDGFQRIAFNVNKWASEEYWYRWGWTNICKPTENGSTKKILSKLDNEETYKNNNKLENKKIAFNKKKKQWVIMSNMRLVK